MPEIHKVNEACCNAIIELVKIKPKTEEQVEFLDKAIRGMDYFQKNTLHNLRKSFEEKNSHF